MKQLNKPNQQADKSCLASFQMQYEILPSECEQPCATLRFLRSIMGRHD